MHAPRRATVRRLRPSVVVGWTLLGCIALLLAWTVTEHVSLFTTHGVSMQPHFRAGDLAVTTRSDDYRVGDIVAYKADRRGTAVLHRIVGITDGRYRFKGDNNSWVDPIRPTRDELYGKLWLRVPRAGIVASVIGSNGTTLALLLAAFVVLTGDGARRVRRRRRPSLDPPDSGSPPDTGPLPATAGAPPTVAAMATPGHPPSPPGPPRPVVPEPSSSPPDDQAEVRRRNAQFYAPASAVAVALLLVGVTSSRPTTRTTTEKRTLGHTTDFTYSAEAPAGAAYPDGRVRTGDPVYRRLVDRLTVAVEHRTTPKRFVPGEDAPDLDGTYAVDAVLTGNGAWKRVVPLQPETEWTGTGFSTKVELELDDLQGLADATQAETGVPNDTLMIDVVARVEATGSVDGTTVEVSTAPALELKMTDLEVSPVDLPKAPETATATDERPISQTDSTAYRAPAVRDRMIGLGGFTGTVTSARRLALLGLLGSCGWIALAAWQVHRRREQSEPELVESRLRARLVSVSHIPNLPAVVEVSDVDSLVAIAERLDRAVLHHHDGDHHTYLVDDGTFYRFRADEHHHARSAEPAVDVPAPTADAAVLATDNWNVGTPPWFVGTPPPFAGTPPPYVAAPEPAAGTEVAATVDPEPDVADAVGETDVRIEPDADQLDAEIDVVADAEPEIVADAEPEVVADAEPEIVADAEPEVVAETEPDVEPAAEATTEPVAADEGSEPPVGPPPLPEPAPDSISGAISARTLDEALRLGPLTGDEMDELGVVDGDVTPADDE